MKNPLGCILMALALFIAAAFACVLFSNASSWTRAVLASRSTPTATVAAPTSTPYPVSAQTLNKILDHDVEIVAAQRGAGAENDNVPLFALGAFVLCLGLLALAMKR
jgi:hypothetical protein